MSRGATGGKIQHVGRVSRGISGGGAELAAEEIENADASGKTTGTYTGTYYLTMTLDMHGKGVCKLRDRVNFSGTHNF